MDNFNTLCQQFPKILNGKPDIENGICSAEINRVIKSQFKDVQFEETLRLKSCLKI